jgi:hypothetical protein
MARFIAERKPELSWRTEPDDRGEAAYAARDISRAGAACAGRTP